MSSKFTSRKFLTAAITASVIALNDSLGLNMPQESIITLAGLIATYILGQSFVDKTKIEQTKDVVKPSYVDGVNYEIRNTESRTRDNDDDNYRVRDSHNDTYR